MSDRKYDGRHVAGDIGPHEVTSELGPCPSCGAMLSIAYAPHPVTGKRSKALAHEMPFCNYYGSTTPEQIESDVKAARSIS